MSVYCTLLMTFSGTLPVIGVDMKPGSTQLHRIPNLEEKTKKTKHCRLIHDQVCASPRVPLLTC